MFISLLLMKDHGNVLIIIACILFGMCCVVIFHPFFFWGSPKFNIFMGHPYFTACRGCEESKVPVCSMAVTFTFPT